MPEDFRQNLVSNLHVTGLAGFTGGMQAAGKSLLALKLIAVGTVAALAAVGVTATKMHAELDTGLRKANTLMNLTGGALRAMGKDVVKLRTEIPSTTKEITEAIYQTVSAGAESHEAMANVRVAAKAAIAGMTDMKAAMTAGMQTVNAFNLSMDQLNRVYDLQFLTVKRGVLEYQDLVQQQGFAISAAVKLGISMEEAYAAIAAMSKVYPIAQATTYLSRALDGLTKHADKLKGLGITIFGDEGQLLRLDDIMRQINDTLEDTASAEDRIKTFEEMGFDIRAARGIVGLTQRLSDLTRNINENYKAAGEMEKAYRIMVETVGNQFKLLKGEIFALLQPLGEALFPMVVESLKTTRGLIRNIREDVAKMEVPIQNIKIALTDPAVTAALEDLHGIFKKISTDWLVRAISRGVFWQGFTDEAATKYLDDVAKKLMEQELLLTRTLTATEGQRFAIEAMAKALGKQVELPLFEMLERLPPTARRIMEDVIRLQYEAMALKREVDAETEGMRESMAVHQRMAAVMERLGERVGSFRADTRELTDVWKEHKLEVGAVIDVQKEMFPDVLMDKLKAFTEEIKNATEAAHSLLAPATWQAAAAISAFQVIKNAGARLGSGLAEAMLDTSYKFKRIWQAMFKDFVRLFIQQIWSQVWPFLAKLVGSLILFGPHYTNDMLVRESGRAYARHLFAGIEEGWRGSELVGALATGHGLGELAAGLGIPASTPAAVRPVTVAVYEPGPSTTIRLYDDRIRPRAVDQGVRLLTQESIFQ